MNEDMDKEQMPPPSGTPGSGKTTPKNEQKPEEKVEDDEEHKKATPAVVRTRQFRDCFQSPSDAVMSPFSQSLNKAIHHPALLKKTQKPKRLQQLTKDSKEAVPAPKP